MKLIIEHNSITAVKYTGIIVNLFEGVRVPGGATGAVDQALGGEISKAIRAGLITGKFWETFVLDSHGKIPAKKVLVVGLGNFRGFSYDGVKEASRVATLRFLGENVLDFGTIVHGAGVGGLETKDCAYHLTQGIFEAALAWGKNLASVTIAVVEFSRFKINLIKEGMEEAIEEFKSKVPDIQLEVKA